ncbi:HAMP domain-containing sensor histidine kinase [Clostridium arbusti]|uniref:HAMP domain-containing sensor histidine kinase n=1 Tax=Clostridium arbusti TaxID=1137848 RepID=UPI000289A48A|nr:HAMP domain-containing sensor histidine kinase [Clostridium arbusti]
MKITLGKKLSLGFLIALIGSLIITSIISNVRISNEFKKYLVDEHNTKINEIVKFIEGSYNKNNGFSNDSQESIVRNANMDELYIEVRDNSGNTLFSSGTAYMQHKNMMNSMMGGRKSSMMGDLSNINTGEYKEEKHEITKDNSVVGTIIIGYYGSSYFSSNSLTFINNLNQSFIISFFITLILGLLISFFLSRQIASPLEKITKTASDMRRGNLGVRSNIKCNTKEIEELACSINYLAETLQNQEELRKRLTSDMAHEIRTPLTTLKTHVEALIDGIWEPSKERFQVFYEELDRLSKLVNNLRNISKLEQAGITLNKSKFDLSSEITNIVDTFKPIFMKQNYLITTEITEKIIVYMDKDNLKQILYNLLSNANKYLEINGRVKVSLFESRGYIVIEVEDNGIGISEKDLPYIFERFYRSDISRDKNSGGSGLGLTITKSLVEANGGKIQVKSKIGEGTAFSIEFPKKDICM